MSPFFDQPKKKDWKKISSLFLSNLHYIGLILMTGIMIKANMTARDAEKKLDDSIEQQDVLRNVLWVNLLSQRATVLTLSPYVTKDPTVFTNALALAHSISRLIQPRDPNLPDAVFLQGKVAEIQSRFDTLEPEFKTGKLYDRPAKIAQLLDQLEKIGADLNEKESTSWYELSEYNRLLLRNLKFRLRIAYVMYLVFLFFAVLFGALSSRKKILDQKLREAETKMVNVAKMSALGEMAGGMAHEINNPLAVIKTTAEQMQDVLEDAEIDKALLKKMASQVSGTAERIAKIVQGLRSFSRDGSRDEVHHFTVEALVQDTLAFCSARFANHGTQIRLAEFSGDLSISGRQTEISQVLLNLLNNAQDAIDQLPEKWIEIRAKSVGEWIEIRVTDSGKGISPAIQTKIFQPFFTTKPIGKGTGLGLSISIGIVQSHGGGLRIDPESPNTSFVIRLPKAKDAVKGAAQAQVA